MKKITEESIKAFYSFKKYKKKNMVVYVDKYSAELRLFRNTIAILNNDKTLQITTCGYNTRTTRDRLNGLKNITVSTKKNQLYLNNERWDGNLKTINL